MEVTEVDPASGPRWTWRGPSRARGRVRWLHGDATSLPELAVDLVTMTANVSHVFLTEQEWSATLRGIFAALRPGGRLVFEARNLARQAWQNWNREGTFVRLDVPGLGEVQTWLDLTEVNGEYVSYRRTYVFAGRRGRRLTSDSTRRLRTRAELEDSLHGGRLHAGRGARRSGPARPRMGLASPPGPARRPRASAEGWHASRPGRPDCRRAGRPRRWRPDVAEGWTSATLEAGLAARGARRLS